MSGTRVFYQVSSPDGFQREYATREYAELEASRVPGVTVAPIYEAQSRTSDKKYRLVYVDGHWVCPCRGYEYRETCGHCDEAVAETGLGAPRPVD